MIGMNFYLLYDVNIFILYLLKQCFKGSVEVTGSIGQGFVWQLGVSSTAWNVSLWKLLTPFYIVEKRLDMCHLNEMQMCP